MNWLRGKRTYILAASALLGILAAYLHGDVTGVDALLQALAATGLVTARVGASNDASAAKP